MTSRVRSRHADLDLLFSLASLSGSIGAVIAATRVLTELDILLAGAARLGWTSAARVPGGRAIATAGEQKAESGNKHH